MSRVIAFVPEHRPQCKAQRVNKYYSDKPGTDYQCCNRAKYLVDGVPLCGKHAGVVALRILTENQTPMQLDAEQANLIDQHTTGVKV